MFFAALMSRSCRARHEGHVRVPECSGSAPRADAARRAGPWTRQTHRRSRSGHGRTGALVLELAAELDPPAIRDRAGRLPVLDHAGDVEVFDDDDIGVADQAGAGAVRRSPARRGPCGGVRATLATALARVCCPSGSGPRAAGNGPGCGPCAPSGGVGDPLPVADGGEVLHTEVDANGVPRALLRGAGVAASTVKVTYQRPFGSRQNDHDGGVQRGWGDIRPGPHVRQRAVRLRQAQHAATHGKRRTGCSARTGGSAGT